MGVYYDVTFTLAMEEIKLESLRYTDRIIFVNSLYHVFKGRNLLNFLFVHGDKTLKRIVVFF